MNPQAAIICEFISQNIHINTDSDMFDVSENSCYLTVIRPPTKSVKHCTTGNCEIERVSFHNNHQDLEYSIRHSKMLNQYKDKYPYSLPYAHHQHEELCQAKNIIDEKSKFYVGKTLRELHCTLYGIHFIENNKKDKYNSKNPTHEKKLVEIWKNLKPMEELEARVSDQWISIGFQVNDPATDFRGAGSLGLHNLHSFSATNKGRKAYHIASDPKTQYFFCSAGLFFTMLASDLLRERKIDYEHWVHNTDQQLLGKFQEIYQLLFMQFTRYWLDHCPNKSIMYFNQNLKEFEKNVKLWSPQLLKARLQDQIQ